MTLKWQSRHRFVVFRRYREHNPPTMEIECRLLDRNMRLADCAALPEDDPTKFIVTDHTAPKRIVEIENEAASAFAAHSGQHPTDVISVERQVVLGTRKFSGKPLNTVVPAGRSDCLDKMRDIQQHVAGS